ncbi:uncharacterized protein [Clytia hemisphaerica]
MAGITNTTILAEISKVSDKIDSIIRTVKPLVEDSVTQFVQNHVKNLGGLIGAYSKCFTSLEVKGREEAEKLWERHLIRDIRLEEQIDLLLDKEKEFDQFLETLDQRWMRELQEKNLEHSKKLFSVGDVIPRDVTFKDENNRSCTIQDFLTEGIRYLVVVVLRHYG